MLFVNIDDHYKYPTVIHSPPSPTPCCGARVQAQVFYICSTTYLAMHFHYKEIIHIYSRAEYTVTIPFPNIKPCRVGPLHRIYLAAIVALIVCISQLSLSPIPMAIFYLRTSFLGSLSFIVPEIEPMAL